MKEVIKLVKSSKDIVLNKSYVDAQKEKGVSDYVTLVDIKVQEHIFNGLKLFPDHQFLVKKVNNRNLILTGQSGYWTLWTAQPI